MEFDPDGQARSFRWAALAGGGGLGIVWFAMLSWLAAASGRPFWPDVLWTLGGAVLAGRVGSLVLRRALDAWWGNTELEVGLADPGAFRTRLARRLVLWSYRPLDPRLAGQGWLPDRRLRAVLPPFLVEWRGGGARVRGPRVLVRLAARLAVP